jgi:phage portal protein BeeE
VGRQRVTRPRFLPVISFEVFGIPPTCAGISENATHSNTEQESISLVTRTLAPLAKRVVTAIARVPLNRGAPIARGRA